MTHEAVTLMSKVRNRHTGKVVDVIDIDEGAGRWQLSCDAPGRARDVGWSAEGLDEHWEPVDAAAEPSSERDGNGRTSVPSPADSA